MINKKLACYLLLQIFSLSAFGQDKDLQQPWYIGVLWGLGSTTWNGLVPTKSSVNEVMTISTPIKTNEGGYVWGGVLGYELIPYFAIEASYMHFPDAAVKFDPVSIFSFKHDDLTLMWSHTETVNVVGKAMFFVPRTRARVFSSAGIANIHREDILLRQWRLSPTFGFGVNYPIAQSWLGEVAGSYTAGFGKSQLSPADSYIPFLYSVSLRLSYYFGIF